MFKYKTKIVPFKIDINDQDFHPEKRLVLVVIDAITGE